MREIYEKDFDYYESQASYFAYTHEADDYDEYFELDREVIKAVKKRGSQDRAENISARSVDQLVEFIIAEGLLPREKTDPVKYELHMDYVLAYDCYEASDA